MRKTTKKLEQELEQRDGMYHTLVHNHLDVLRQKEEINQYQIQMEEWKMKAELHKEMKEVFERQAKKVFEKNRLYELEKEKLAEFERQNLKRKKKSSRSKLIFTNYSGSE